MRARTLLFLVLVLLLVPVAARASVLTSARACAPPRGPGDNAVHSRNLRVRGISCRVGRKVALACVRFTYGHSGRCSAGG